MGLNPANNDRGTEWKDHNAIGVESAEVIRTQSHTEGDNVSHVVYVKPSTINETVPADVNANQVGDVQIPTEGSRVTIAYRPNERPLVVGQRYKDDNTVPDFEPGERVVGHPLSEAHIRLAEDGSITIKGDAGNTIELASDGSVTINGGSTKAITDVSAGGFNNEGGITSLDITRSSDVYLP